jgi:hypothetical protein
MEQQELTGNTYRYLIVTTATRSSSLVSSVSTRNKTGSGKKTVCQARATVRETKRAVTPWGGIAILVQFLKGIGYIEAGGDAMPIQMNSPNAIALAQTFTTFLIAVAVGARMQSYCAPIKLWAGDPGN